MLYLYSINIELKKRLFFVGNFKNLLFIFKNLSKRKGITGMKVTRNSLIYIFLSISCSIFGNKPVNSTILGFVANGKYNLGEATTFTGIAKDINGKYIKKADFIWRTHYRHDDHWHDSFDVASGDSLYYFYTPGKGDLSPSVFFRIQMITPYSSTTFDTIYYDIFPKVVKISFNSNIKSIKGKVLNFDHFADTTAKEVNGGFMSVSLNKIQTISGISYTFTGWSNGSTATSFNFFLTKDTTFYANFTGPFTEIEFGNKITNIETPFYPTLISNNEIIFYPDLIQNKNSIEIYDFLGKKVPHYFEKNIIKFTEKLPTGTYFIKYTINNTNLQITKFLNYNH